MALKTVLIGVSLATVVLDYGVLERTAPQRALARLTALEEQILASLASAHPCAIQKFTAERDASVSAHTQCTLVTTVVEMVKKGSGIAYGFNPGDFNSLDHAAVRAVAGATPQASGDWRVELSASNHPQTLVMLVNRATGAITLQNGSNWQ